MDQKVVQRVWMLTIDNNFKKLVSQTDDGFYKKFKIINLSSLKSGTVHLVS